jgi:hypothetical protein
MQKYWSNQGVDLAKLTQKIEEFFKDNLFDIKAKKTETIYRLTAKSSANYILDGQIELILTGQPEDFTVNVELQRTRSTLSKLPIIGTTLLGGGYFLFRNAKYYEEEWNQFKKDFGDYLEKTVNRLKGTSRIQA